MSIILRAKTNPSLTNGTSLTVNKPTGTLAGDFMLLLTTVSNPAASILQAPAGWTEIQRGGINDDDPAVGWFKVAGASEPANYTLTTNLTGAIGAGILSFYSDTAQPITIDDVQQQFNASGNRVYPAVTFSAAGYLVCYGTTLIFSSTPPGSMNEQWDVTISSNRAYCMTEIIASAGATGTRTATGTTAASNCVSLALVEGATVYRCPQWRSFSSYGPTNSTTSFNVTIPADVVLGDLLLLQVVTDADRVITTPGGWTLLNAQAGAGGQHIYSRMAEAGDAGATVTVAFAGGTVAMIGIIAAIYSPNGKPLTITGTATGSGTAAAGITYPSATANGIDALLVGIAANSATTGVEPAAHNGFFERIDLGSTACRTFWGTELLSSSGATATRALNFTSGTQDYFAFSLVVEEVTDTNPKPALSGLSINVNQLTAELFDRNDEPTPVPFGLSLAVRRYDALAAGGYNYAEIEVSGYSEAIWSAAGWLGYYVRIRDHNHSVVWMGLIDELMLSMGAVEMGLSLKEMYNRIAVTYSTTGFNAERGTTAWGENAASVARYGAKDLLYTMSDAALAQAETQRETLLATLARPVPTVRINPGGATNRATLHCTGLIKTLGWCNYGQPVGLEEHIPAGSTTQPVGNGLTADAIAFVTDGQIVDLQGRLGAVQEGHRVTVSGSADNDGAYLIEDTPRDDGKSYSSATIFFDATDDIHDDTNQGLGLATVGDYIAVSDSAGNDGIYRVNTAGATHLTVDPSSITTAAAGPTVTISRGNAIRTAGELINEAPGATVTLTIHGQKVAQSFSLGHDADWTVDQVVLRLVKIGAPADAVKVELCADSSGAPGTVLASGTVAAANIGTRSTEIAFDLGNTETISYGTTYHLVVSRTGANNIQNYYMVDVDEDLGYSRGSLQLWTGAAWTGRATDADLIFRVMGATPTTTQIAEIVSSDCGQFLAGIDIIDASGVDIWQYRAGDNNGLQELDKLLALGTSSGARLLAVVSQERILRIRSQPANSSENLLLSSDGRLRDASNRYFPYGGLPAGKWLRLADVPGNVDALAALANVFIERAEFDADSGQLTMEAQGEIAAWNPKPTAQETAQQAAALKPFIVGW